MTKLFERFSLAQGITLRNRVVMAPMTTWSANDDRTISDQEDAYYRRRVKGVGLVITGCSHVSPSGIGFTDEFASYDDRFLPSLRRLADAAKSGGARAVLQVFHAGNRAVPELIPGGDVVSASALTGEPSPFAPCEIPARALTHPEILAIVADFGQATRRAIEAGFDGVELHGAHSFLIQNFLSPRYNQRTDVWGGSAENRMRFPLAVVHEVKRVIAAHAQRPFVLGYRLSPEEDVDGGLRLDDALGLIDGLVEAGVDYVHASLASVLQSRPIGEVTGETLTHRIVRHVAGRVPVIAAGQLRTPAQAEAAIASGLSLVAIGQGLVMNPDWLELALDGRADEIQTAIDPAKVARLVLPAKLWATIQAATGWFTLKSEPALATAEA
jgi:2,4-dienoyl-CoA reductase-like NADH-dependent reductase (Old Yellow Enzyme family)